MLSLSYVLAASLRELFPDVEIFQIKATSACFFCDLHFSGQFTPEILGFLEERMRVWVRQKSPFQVLEMVPSNAVQFLKHHGEKKLARAIQSEQNLVTLVRLGSWFFRGGAKMLQTTADTPFFKLVCFWPLKNGIRILGAGAFSKEQLKGDVQKLKSQQDPQKKLESFGLVSWLQNQLVWEAKGEVVKDILRKKIMTLYHEFDRVFIAAEGDIKNVIVDWVGQRKRSGYEFETKRVQAASLEPWGGPLVSIDRSWGKLEEITSFLHLATKFLTILTFDYKVVNVGKVSGWIKKILDSHFPSWTTCEGGSSRLEFQVMDSLGQLWVVSSLEWDQKRGFLQMHLCASLERCIALMVDKLESFETLLDRLK